MSLEQPRREQQRDNVSGQEDIDEGRRRFLKDTLKMLVAAVAANALGIQGVRAEQPNNESNEGNKLFLDFKKTEEAIISLDDGKKLPIRVYNMTLPAQHKELNLKQQDQTSQFLHKIINKLGDMSATHNALVVMPKSKYQEVLSVLDNLQTEANNKEQDIQLFKSRFVPIEDKFFYNQDLTKKDIATLAGSTVLGAGVGRYFLEPVAKAFSAESDPDESDFATRATSILLGALSGLTIAGLSTAKDKGIYTADAYKDKFNINEISAVLAVDVEFK